MARYSIKVGKVQYRRPEYTFISDQEMDEMKAKAKKILIQTAKKGRTIFYSDLAPKVSDAYPYQEDPRYSLLSHLIGELSLEAANDGDPLISALVVHKPEGGAMKNMEPRKIGRAHV